MLQTNKEACMAILRLFKGLIVNQAKTLVRTLLVPVLDKLVEVMDFLPDLIEGIAYELRCWAQKHRGGDLD